MSGAPAADQVLQILRFLAASAEPLSAGSISQGLGLPRSTTYKLLTSLVEQQFVVYVEGERRYGLGLQSYELGSSYQRQLPLRRIAHGAVSRLVDEVGQTAHLTVLHGTDSYYVIEERAVRRPPLVTDVGVRLPACLTASGLAILAGLSPAQLRAIYPTPDAFVQRDGRGPRRLSELRSILGDARTRGYAVEDQSVTPGLASVGVAVRDHTGHPVAAVSVTFDVARLDADGPRLASAVARTAGALSRRLGSVR